MTNCGLNANGKTKQEFLKFDKNHGLRVCVCERTAEFCFYFFYAQF